MQNVVVLIPPTQGTARLLMECAPALEVAIHVTTIAGNFTSSIEGSSYFFEEPSCFYLKS